MRYGRGINGRSADKWESVRQYPVRQRFSTICDLRGLFDIAELHDKCHHDIVQHHSSNSDKINMIRSKASILNYNVTTRKLVVLYDHHVLK